MRHWLAGLALVLLAGCATHGPNFPGETIHRDVVYAERGGRKLHIDLYVPVRKQKPVPVVVWIHGGGWKFGNKGFNLQIRKLAREGLAVASIEYRLLGAARWPAQLDDCRKAVGWLRTNGQQYGIEARRMGLAGESAGGHLAALLALQEKRRKIGAVCVLYPPTDLVAMGERYSRYRRLSVFNRMFGGEVQDRRAAAWAASPVAYVGPQAPPFRFYHGEKDWIVPPEQSQALHDRLRAAGVESELIRLPGRGHAFALTAEQLAEVAAFFRKRL